MLRENTRPYKFNLQKKQQQLSADKKWRKQDFLRVKTLLSWYNITE